MASSEGRRAFLLGITLNELGFIMFFLLMIISAATLQQTKQKLEQEIEQKANLQADIIQARQDYEDSFKRLQLLETRLMQAGGFSAKPSEQQLDALFSRLQEATTVADIQQENVVMQRQLDALERYKRLAESLETNGIDANSPQQMLEQLVQQTEAYRKEQQLLKGRVAFMQKKLQSNGLDHPPCWADPQSGAVEYLYSMTLYEHHISIEAAWPDYRKADLRQIPGAEKLAGQRLTPQQLQQQVQPVFNWSKLHECRHFVRIKDDSNTSKDAFKRQMLTVEAYFYKYLQR